MKGAALDKASARTISRSSVTDPATSTHVGLTCPCLADRIPTDVSESSLGLASGAVGLEANMHNDRGAGLNLWGESQKWPATSATQRPSFWLLQHWRQSAVLTLGLLLSSLTLSSCGIIGPADSVTPWKTGHYAVEETARQGGNEITPDITQMYIRFGEGEIEFSVPGMMAYGGAKVATAKLDSDGHTFRAEQRFRVEKSYSNPYPGMATVKLRGWIDDHRIEFAWQDTMVFDAGELLPADVASITRHFLVTR